MDVKRAIEILGIKDEDAKSLTKAKIRRQYLFAALKTHPDKVQDGTDSSENFIQLKEAYNTLLQYHAQHHLTDNDDHDYITVSDEDMNSLLKSAFQGDDVVELYIKKFNMFQPPPLFGIDLSVPFHKPSSPILSTSHTDDMQQLFKEAFENAGLDPDGNPLEGWARPPSTEDN